MELLILSHVPTRVLEEGFIPAAIDLKLKVSILTDCVREHLSRAKESSVYRQCELLECDVFNPLAVARLLSVRGLEFSGVLAAHASLRPSAAMVANYLALPGPSWRSTLLCDQRAALRDRFEPDYSPAQRWVVNCSEPDAEIGTGSFPVTVQPLETGVATGGAIIRSHQELKRKLADMRDGYALIEKHQPGEVYALDALATPDGFAILCGSHIQFNDDQCRTKRIASFMPQPPRCDEVLAMVSALDPGLGRHHVEYAVTGSGIRIREMHDGLHDDESEFAVNAQWGGDLFKATVKVCLGIPVKPPRRLRTGAMLADPVLEASV